MAGSDTTAGYSPQSLNATSTSVRSESRMRLDYYDAYWTDEGVNPPSNLGSDLGRLLLRATEPGTRVLDLGCGDGSTAGRFLQDHGRLYTGVDVSRTAIETAKGRGFEAHVIEDAGSLPFPAASFDAVVCIEVLEHLWAPHEAAAEALRVLKPGGTFFATTPNAAYWRRRMDLALFGRWNPFGYARSVDEPWRDPHIRFFTRAAMRRMIQRAGFADVRIGGHECCLLYDIPGVRKIPGINKFAGRLDPPILTRALASSLPNVFGCRVNVRARKPWPGQHSSEEPGVTAGLSGIG
jgi:SAM-dependent methyltransferase